MSIPKKPVKHQHAAYYEELPRIELRPITTRMMTAEDYTRFDELIAIAKTKKSRPTREQLRKIYN